MAKNNKSKNIIDQDVIAKELDPAERGRLTGQENKPHSSALSPCGNENDMRGHHELLEAEDRKNFDEEQQTQELERAEMFSELDVAKAKAPRSEARQSVVTLQTELAGDIKEAAKHRDSCARHLAVLRDKGIDVSKTALGSYSLLLVFLFFFLIVEALANSYMLGQGNDYGLLGGAIEALFIASLSIALSYSSGIGIRAIFGKGMLRRTLSIVAGLCYGTALVGYHSIIGWYRAALVYGNPDNAASDALINFVNNGLALPDLYSYALIIVGLFFGGIAFLSGLHSQDVKLASFYARINEKFHEAEVQLRKLEVNYLTNVNLIYIGKISLVEKLQKAANAAGHNVRKNVLQNKFLANSYKNRANAIRLSYEYAVRLFRSSNEAVRSTFSPAYFADEPIPLNVADSAYGTELNDAAQVGDLEQFLQTFHSVAEEEKGHIREDHEACLREAPGFFARSEYPDIEEADSPKQVEKSGGKTATVEIMPIIDRNKEAGNVYAY